MLKIVEPVLEKTQQFGFRPGPTQTGLNNHKRLLEAGSSGFRKNSNCTIRVEKTKALINFAVTEKLICAFDFANADYWFSHAKAQLCFTLARLWLASLQFNDNSIPCCGSNCCMQVIPKEQSKYHYL